MPRKSRDPDYEAKTVKSAERVLDILILLGQCKEGLKLKDIGQRLKIPASSLHAILNTMKNRDFIERDESTLLYTLSRRVYQIVPSSSHSEEDLVYLALPIMEKVLHSAGETVSLSVLDGNELVFIAQRSSSAILKVVQALGSRFPAYATGSGKVMLSFLDEKLIDKFYPDEALPRLTKNTITSKTQLLKELENIRSLGFAIDNEESVDGVWAVAGCIRGRDGHSIAATSIVVPKIRVTNELEKKFTEIITTAAEDISLRLRAKFIK